MNRHSTKIYVGALTPHGVPLRSTHTRHGQNNYISHPKTKAGNVIPHPPWPDSRIGKCIAYVWEDEKGCLICRCVLFYLLLWWRHSGYCNSSHHSYFILLHTTSSNITNVGTITRQPPNFLRLLVISLIISHALTPDITHQWNELPRPSCSDTFHPMNNIQLEEVVFGHKPECEKWTILSTLTTYNPQHNTSLRSHPLFHNKPCHSITSQLLEPMARILVHDWLRCFWKNDGRQSLGLSDRPFFTRAAFTCR
jgi:hypothetical protein